MISSLKSSGTFRVSTTFARSIISPSITSTISRNTNFVKCFSTTQPTFDRVVASKVRVPPPTDKIPDVNSFLTAIGRQTVEHADTFETWENLMTMSSEDMGEKGIDVRSRRYVNLDI